MKDTIVDNDNMSPLQSPQSQKTGVKKVNNVPIYLVGGLVLSFLAVMGVVAYDKSGNAQTTVKQDEKAHSATAMASAISGNNEYGLIQPPDVPTLPASAPLASASMPVDLPADLPTPTISADAPPLPQNNPMDEQLAAIQRAKMQQLNDAIRARTTVSAAMPTSTYAPSAALGSSNNDVASEIARVRSAIDHQVSSGGDAMAVYQAQLKQVQAANGGADSFAPAGLGGGNLNAPPTPPRMLPTSSGAGEDKWTLPSAVQAPSPYELRAGFVMPATLISGINSELPGQIIGQVSQNIYDTATGKNKLIPQGSRLIGQYSSETQFGQSRVLIAWNRIIFPDGKALDIGSMPGSDSSGYSGFNDKTNNHYMRIFTSALLMSGVTAAVSLSTDRNQQKQDANGNTNTVSGALSQALGQQLGGVAANLIQKNMNTSPTLEIRPGYRFNVVVMKDIKFTKPYKSYDY